MQRALNEASLVFLDLETTGLSVERGDEIIEVGAVRVVGGQETAHLETLIRPSKPIPPESTRIHGISDLFVIGAPAFADFAAELLAFLDGSVLIAHNAPFDLGFLAVQLEACGHALPDNHVLDTVALSRTLMPELHNHKLDTLKKHYGVKADRAHRALDDSRALSRVFLKLVECYFPMLDGGPRLGSIFARGGSPLRFDDFQSGLPIPDPEHRALVRAALREGGELLVTIQNPGRFSSEEVRLRLKEVSAAGTDPALLATDASGGNRSIPVSRIKDIRWI